MAFKCQRWTLANVLPVAFVIWIIGTIWFLYGWLHLWVLLQLHVESALRDEARFQRGFIQACVSQSLTLLLLICFIRAIFTDPGSVPETPEWRNREYSLKAKYSSEDTKDRDGDKLEHHEVKQSGERRFCKWCDRYKPDRCHHCRVCRSCILRMDHHCPWIANCVGFRNHKFFFLLVFYALADVAFIIITMTESVTRAVTDETPSKHRFLLVFCMTLSVIMGLLLQMFFALHVWLMLKATTTIEFCEKRHRRTVVGGPVSWNVGIIKNMQAVLGSNFFLWLLPLSPPDGEGLYFERATRNPGEAQESSETAALLADQANKEEGASSSRAHGQAASSGAPESSAPEVTGDKAAAV